MDVYSFAMVCFEMATRKQPFDELEDFQARRRRRFRTSQRSRPQKYLLAVRCVKKAAILAPPRAYRPPAIFDTVLQQRGVGKKAAARLLHCSLVCSGLSDIDIFLLFPRLRLLPRAQILHKVVNERARPDWGRMFPTSGEPGQLPNEFRDLVEQCWAHEPARPARGSGSGALLPSVVVRLLLSEVPRCMLLPLRVIMDCCLLVAAAAAITTRVLDDAAAAARPSRAHHLLFSRLPLSRAGGPPGLCGHPHAPGGNSEDLPQQQPPQEPRRYRDRAPDGGRGAGGGAGGYLKECREHRSSRPRWGVRAGAAAAAWRDA